MPLRPFPISLSIGTDIVHVNRITSILIKAQGRPKYLDSFLRRFLTPREQHVFTARYAPTGELNKSELGVVSRHLAGRWAAKEATIKAVTWRRLSFHDVVILRSEDRGRVSAVILDQAASRQRDDEAGMGRAKSLRQRGAPDDADLSGEFQAVDSGPQEPSPFISSGGIPRLAEPAKPRDTHTGRDLSSIGHDSSEHGWPLQSDAFSNLSGQVARISISHDGEYATAVCLAAEEPGDGDVGGEAAAREPV